MRGSEYFDLRAFVAITEHGSFVRAAHHLGMAPSSLSQVIRQLENRLDVQLLKHARPALAELPTVAERAARTTSWSAGTASMSPQGPRRPSSTGSRLT